MDNDNISELIVDAEDQLQLGKHNRCFKLLDTFFNRLSSESLIYESKDILRHIKTRYSCLDKEIMKGTISYDQKRQELNEISDALYL